LNKPNFFGLKSILRHCKSGRPDVVEWHLHWVAWVWKSKPFSCAHYSVLLELQPIEKLLRLLHLGVFV